MASPHAVIEKLKALTKPGAALNPKDRWEIDIVCEAAKVVLLHGVQELVSDANRAPILSSKSCDGTPMSLVHRDKRVLPSGRAVRSSGHQGVEWLVQNQFVRAQLPHGEWVTRILLSDPCILQYGKACQAILALSYKHWRTLRSLGHFGCSIEHYVFDRAGYSKMVRLVRQWHADFEYSGLPEDLTEEMARVTEFVIVTPCALHDAQNAFKWGFMSECADRQMMRDIYVAIESLRKSADLLSKHLAMWVSKRLRMVPPRGLAWVESQRVLYNALSVDWETVELLAETLELEFRDGELLVSNGADVDGDLVECVCATLKSAWKFVKFTESRWLTVGTSARTIVVAMLTGVQNLVTFILKETNSSFFFLKGFLRLSEDRLQFLVQASLASRVAEGVQAELLEDSRVALIYKKLWAAATEELKWIIDLDTSVWVR